MEKSGRDFEAHEVKLVTSAKMRELEQRADASGNSYGTMMERAGQAAAKAIAARLDVNAKNIIVLVGPGNNGGDGLVCARYLHDAGARVLLYPWKRTLDDDDENLQLCLVRNIPLVRAEDDGGFFELLNKVAACDVIVDALLGTGVARPIDGLLKGLLQAIEREIAKSRSQLSGLVYLDVWQRSFTQVGNENEREAALGGPDSTVRKQNKLIIAIDLPSGLNPDTGAIDPAALCVDLTVTFAFPKLGQMIFPGAQAVGELIVADIGIPAEWANDVEIQVASARDIAARLPIRHRDSHKGTYGKAMICAGSLNYTGAAYLSAMAATHAGTGLVTLALARTIYPFVASAAHETTFVPLPDANGILIPTAARTLQKNLAVYDALLIGPGLGRNAKTVEFVQHVLGLGEKKSPLNSYLQREVKGIVIDADALYALAQSGEWWKLIQANTAILTPHPGEMATLCGLKLDEIQGDRIATAKRFAQAWQQVVILKGADSVVAAPDGRITLIPFATPALATAGTGDVLAGTIAAMLAQGLEIYDAAVVGAYVHGCAGKIAEEEIGLAGVVAGDLLTRLPQAIRRINK